MENFVRALVKAAQSLGQPLSETRIESYVEALNHMDEDLLIRGLEKCMLQDVEFLPSYGRIFIAANGLKPSPSTFVDDEIVNTPEQIAQAMEYVEEWKRSMGWA